jgi:TonB-dependent SusC/RagA subfamily outer membrane receptor
MESVAVYLFKYGIWISLFGSVYWFFFRKETFFGFNRAFLLCGLVLSFALASCQYRYSVVLNLPLTAFSESSPVQEVQPGVAVRRPLVVMGIYLAGAFILLLHHLNGLNKICNIIRKQCAHPHTSPPVIEVAEIQSSFSFFGYILMDKSVQRSEVERQLILEHETAHIEQRHWVDLLLAQTVCILQWFNPFAWLYLRAIKENHEFLADRSVLRKGNSPAVYHAALINCSLKTPVFALTSSFTYYNNKFKRIIMMKKNASKSTRKFAVLLLIPAFAIFLLAFAKPEYDYSVITEQDKIVSNDSIVALDAGISDRPVVVFTKPIYPASTPTEQDKVITKDSVMVITADTLSLNKAPAAIKLEKKKDIVYYVDGKEVSSIKNLNANDIHSMNTSKSNVMSTCEKGTTPHIFYTKEVITIITKKHAQETEKADENKDATFTGKAEDKSGTRFTLKGAELLTMVDDKEYSGDVQAFVDANEIESVIVWKDASAIARYGEKGKDGVIIITTKAAAEAKKKQ